MAYNDPVLQRSMFQKQGPAVTPAVGLGAGLGSMTTPDENAKALRSMFAPTVDVSAPAEMLQQPQPVQSFQEGGLAEPVTTTMPGSPAARAAERRAQARAELEARARAQAESGEPGIGTKLGAAALDLATLPYQFGTGFFGGKSTSLTPFYDEYVRRPRGETGTAPPSPAQKAGAAFGDVMASPAPVVQKIGSLIDPREISPPSTYTPRFDVLRRAEEERAAEEAGIASIPIPQRPQREAIEEPPAAPPAAAPAAAPAREKGALELTLEGIREERARSAEDKRQNALLALMQAGFAMAAGRSPNAISNIGAGGQAGIAAFAQMEKARREENAALRREETAIRLAQAKMAEDPEAVKTFRILGGGDIMKGFEIFNADKKLQAAIAVTKDITAAEEDRKAANDYIRGQLTKARTGGGSFAGFSATPVR